MRQKHVFACFTRAQLCISSFACKLLCRHSTVIAKVNSSINFDFGSSIITLYFSKIKRNIENVILCADIDVDKYVGRSIEMDREHLVLETVF